MEQYITKMGSNGSAGAVVSTLDDWPLLNNSRSNLVFERAYARAQPVSFTLDIKI